MLGIDFNYETQKALKKELRLFQEEYDSENFKRFNPNNAYYYGVDAFSFYAMILHISPGRIIEIGSGHSSALMHDINENHFDNEMKIVHIEPNPDRLKHTCGTTGYDLIQKKVQDVDLSLFEGLSSGDILFVDSSHIVKRGSDVNHILFEIIPRLDSGVLIHFHDIFPGFDYPIQWYENGRSWNESFFLRSFLQYNSEFEIILSVSGPADKEKWYIAPGSLWIKRK
jgi:hypothetical protein